MNAINYGSPNHFVQKNTGKIGTTGLSAVKSFAQSVDDSTLGDANTLNDDSSEDIR